MLSCIVNGILETNLFYTNCATYKHVSELQLGLSSSRRVIASKQLQVFQIFQVCLFCTFVFILGSAAKVISEHRPINVVSQPGIEPGPLRFQYNHETHYDTEENMPSWAKNCVFKP